MVVAVWERVGEGVAVRIGRVEVEDEGLVFGNGQVPVGLEGGGLVGGGPRGTTRIEREPLESLKSNWARLPFEPESRVSRGNPAESPESVLISPFSPPVSSGNPRESEKPLRIGSFVSSSKPPESLKSLWLFS